MSKLKVCIIFGGRSGEHEVSIVSAQNVAKALSAKKYHVSLIGIDKSGRWVPVDHQKFIHAKNPRNIKIGNESGALSMIPYSTKENVIDVNSAKSQAVKKVIKNKTGKGKPKAVIKSNKNEIGSSKLQTKFDVILPILHGTFGEDGTIQGLLELAGVPYVGSGVLGSSVGMDKDIARRLMRDANIPVVPTVVIRKHEFLKNPKEIYQKILNELGLPFFIKPANAGSSVGVHKIKSEADFKTKIKDSFLYDNKILAEKSIQARELEVAVLGNYEPKASIVGEIIPQHEFYSYEAKYLDDNGALLKIPAENLSPKETQKIQDLAIQTFKLLELRGMARVDFFKDKQTGELYLNEVNTIPGFTNISMYPKLWEASGVSYSNLLDTLITLAIEQHKEKSALKTSFI